MKKLFAGLIGLLSLTNIYSQDSSKCASWDLNGDNLKDVEFCTDSKTKALKEIYYYPSGDTLEYYVKNARGDLSKKVEFQDYLDTNLKLKTIRKEYIYKEDTTIIKEREISE